MSIRDNKMEYLAALRKAEAKWPHKARYQNSPDNCDHDFSFVIYCNGGDWDIARCLKCGEQRVVRCTFDDDYD